MTAASKDLWKECRRRSYCSFDSFFRFGGEAEISGTLVMLVQARPNHGQTRNVLEATSSARLLGLFFG
jgi:hypothetical protein